MVTLSLHNAGIGWQVREQPRKTDIASTWNFFSRLQAVQFLSDRYLHLQTNGGSQVELAGICFSELSVRQTTREMRKN